MIHNAVIHIPNEQPLLADLPEMPTGADFSLVCTNLRTTTGTRPAFVDRSDSVFVFPYERIRFVEIPATGVELVPVGDTPRSQASRGRAAPAPPPVAPPDQDLEIDEDFLRRVREI